MSTEGDARIVDEIVSLWITDSIEVRIERGFASGRVDDGVFSVTPDVAVRLSETLRESADNLLRAVARFDVLN